MAARPRKTRKGLYLPEAGRIATLPTLGDVVRARKLPPLVSAHPRAGIVATEIIQPTFEEFRASPFYRRYPSSSYPEYLTDWALKKLRLREHEDYLYQVPELGQYTREAGSTIVDFVVINRWPWLALPVQGLFWHPTHGEKYEVDLLIMRRLRIEKRYEVIALDEDDLLLNAKFFVSQALIGRDYSRYARPTR